MKKVYVFVRDVSSDGNTIQIQMSVSAEGKNDIAMSRNVDFTSIAQDINKMIIAEVNGLMSPEVLLQPSDIVIIGGPH